jgi:hypothetical protein
VPLSSLEGLAFLPAAAAAFSGFLFLAAAAAVAALTSSPSGCGAAESAGRGGCCVGSAAAADSCGWAAYSCLFAASQGSKLSSPRLLGVAHMPFFQP